MSEPTAHSRPGTSRPGQRGESSAQSSAPSGGGREGGGPPAERGRTTIDDGVVEKIAGLATREVVGVHAMGGGVARTIGAVRDRVPGGKSAQRGVKAEVGEVQTALDLELVVDYGVSIAGVARTVRENVISSVERMTELEVVEVNISVSDVKLPDEEDDGESRDDQERRLQ